MDRIEETDASEVVPLEDIQRVLEDAPVQVAILFGPHVTDKPHGRSDVDIAIELQGLRPGDEGYNDAFFGLIAELSQTLGTDDVSLVDVHSLSDPLARVVFDTGVFLFGDAKRAAELEQRRYPESDRTPRERFDDVLRCLDEHLG